MKQKAAGILALICLIGCLSGCGDPYYNGNVSTTENGTVNGSNRTLSDNMENPVTDSTGVIENE